MATIWSPPEEAKGIVQICHGMCEYIDRYDHFARYLAGHGYLVCGNDHIGHGRTAGSEEKLGYFSPSGGGKHLTDDVHQLVQRMQREYPSLPYFLLGHSMGSFITRNYIVQYPKGLSGYICCGTSGPNPLAGIGLRTANHLIKKHGDHYRSELLQSLAFKN
ncbi:MAG: alpha/beta fold hydrolase, partial [Massilioclostridium sp.]|nr:alpha/beta fold hydrolase [Massilioclostridium sp.]